MSLNKFYKTAFFDFGSYEFLILKIKNDFLEKRLYNPVFEIPKTYKM